MDHGPSDKVDFIIAGTQRGGTTTLVEYLMQHPQISIPTKKELHFFDKERLWQAGPPDYEAYHALFPAESPSRLKGEATPIYMYWHPALMRIRAYNPKIKLIMILRNPITRAYSHWNRERSVGRERLAFREALLAEPARASEALPSQLRHASYIERGMYTSQLERIWELFPREQTLILRTDDFSRALAPMFTRLADFLGITRFTPTQEIVAHEGTYDRRLEAADGLYLASVFEEEIKRLEKLLGWDCSDWLAVA
jgi:hypothetical protein